MAKFEIIYKTEPLDEHNGTPTNDLVKNHIDHLRNLSKNGILFFCGISKDYSGALLIFEAKSYEDAEKYLLQDPLIIKKYYSYAIHELIEANEKNNWLMDDI
jgi:uncharacterized protein YciI